jgi:hypothetical protein
MLSLALHCDKSDDPASRPPTPPPSLLLLLFGTIRHDSAWAYVAGAFLCVLAAVFLPIDSSIERSVNTEAALLFGCRADGGQHLQVWNQLCDARESPELIGCFRNGTQYHI